MDSNMYIPFSLGITTLVSLLALVVGQIMTWLRIGKMMNTRHCMMAGAGVAAVAASKSGWFKSAWEFIKILWAKFKDKFKDKAAEKIVDTTVDNAVKK